jgi:hypothetical protein
MRITWSNFCPCKYFTKVYLVIQYSSRIGLREEAALYPSGGRGWKEEVSTSIITFRHWLKNIASFSGTGPAILPTKFWHFPQFYKHLLARVFILSEVLRSWVRCFTAHAKIYVKSFEVLFENFTANLKCQPFLMPYRFFVACPAYCKLKISSIIHPGLLLPSFSTNCDQYEKFSTLLRVRTHLAIFTC